MVDVAITGVGRSALERRAVTPLGDLAAEAVRAALDDAGLAPADVGGVLSAPDIPFGHDIAPVDGTHFVSASCAAARVGLERAWTMDTPGTLGNALVDAVEAVSEGRAEHLVLLRALHSPAGAYGHTAEVRADGIDQWRSPYGLHPVALAAQWWTRYQHLHRSGSREQMAVVARQARANGLARGGGYWAQRDAPPLADADYLSAPLVSTPLSVLDCDLPVQVASAFVLSSGALARSLRQSPAHVLAAVRSPTGSTYGLTSWCLEPVRTEAGAMGAALWSAAGVRPRDVDVAELYDGFSIFVVGWLEGLGLAPTGTGFDFLQDGRTARTGALPVNPSGGSLGNGRLHGAEQLSDGVFQVTGRAGACQVSGASTAVVAVGPPSSMAGAVVLAAD